MSPTNHSSPNYSASGNTDANEPASETSRQPEAPHNPFAPPTDADANYSAPAQLDARQIDGSKPSILRSVVTWTVICVISAAPSFYWGWGTVARNQMLAMLCGIAVFIALYITADQSPWAMRLRRNRNIRLAMQITYGTRIGISVIFPAALFADAIVGMASTSIVFGSFEALGISPEDGRTGFGRQSFLACFATTIVQGCLLNCVLAAYGFIVWGIVSAVRSR